MIITLITMFYVLILGIPLRIIFEYKIYINAKNIFLVVKNLILIFLNDFRSKERKYLTLDSID